MIQDRICIEIIDHQMAEVLRNKTPAERLMMANNMWRMARQMVDHAVRVERPEMSEAEVCREVAKRMSHGAV